MKDLSKATISCTGLGDIMTEPQAAADKAAGNLSVAAKEYLNQVFIKAKYGRKKEIESKYFEKGRQVESAGIELYCALSGQHADKNEEFIFNDLIHGIPDLIYGDSKNASLVVDVKAPFDLWTFYKARTGKMDKGYWWQVQGYMFLTGAPMARLAYTLIDIPPYMLAEEKRKLGWKLGASEEDVQVFADTMEQFTKAHTYSDIPPNERIFCFDIPRDEEAIKSIEPKVIKARQHLLELDKKAAFQLTEVPV